jgi:hypothetical protein
VGTVTRGAAAHLAEHVRGHADQGEEQLERVAAAALREHCFELPAVLASLAAVVLDVGRVWRLVEDQPVDRKPCSDGVEGEGRTRGMSVDRGPAAGPGDQRGEVLDLALDGVGQRVAASAASPPVIVDDRKVAGEMLGGRSHPGRVTAGACDQDQRRSGAHLLEGDERGVGRHCLGERGCMVRLLGRHAM